MNVSPLTRQLLGVALGTALVLLVPLVAGRVSSEVNWGAGDFAAAAVLLMSGAACVLWVLRRAASRSARVLGVVAAVLFVALVWAELAVGLFH